MSHLFDDIDFIRDWKKIRDEFCELASSYEVEIEAFRQITREACLGFPARPIIGEILSRAKNLPPAREAATYAAAYDVAIELGVIAPPVTH